MECYTIFSVLVYKPAQLCHSKSEPSKSYLNMMSNKRKRNDLSLADKYEVKYANVHNAGLEESTRPLAYASEVDGRASKICLILDRPGECCFSS